MILQPEVEDVLTIGNRQIEVDDEFANSDGVSVVAGLNDDGHRVIIKCFSDCQKEFGAELHMLSNYTDLYITHQELTVLDTHVGIVVMRYAGTPITHCPGNNFTMLRKSAQTLADLHERYGVVHGDIKPDNICYDGERIRIIDWDRAHDGGHDSNTKYHSGTVPFSSPEQMQDRMPVVKSDVYGMAMTVVYMLSDHETFYEHFDEEDRNISRRQIINYIDNHLIYPVRNDDPLIVVLKKCFKYNPADRPTVGKLAKVLRH